MKKTICLLLVLVLGLSLFGGCTPKNNNASNPSEPVENTPNTGEEPNSETTIGFSCGWAWVPYTIATKLGAEVAASEEGVKLVCTSADNDMQTQIADVENLTEKNIDGLLMYAIDSAGLSPIAEETMTKGINVGTVDVGVSETKVDFHVASDNYEIGCIAARYVGDYLGEEGGNVAIVGWSTVDATVDREAGFKDTIADEYPNVNIVAYYGDGGSDRTKALNAAENILQAHPETDLIWGSNQQASLGALAAVDAANVDIPVVGVDSDVESLTALIENPNFVGTVSQDPYMMGYTAVKKMVALLKGEKVEENVVTETYLVTKENAAEFLEKEQHYQDLYNSGEY